MSAKGQLLHEVAAAPAPVKPSQKPRREPTAPATVPDAGVPASMPAASETPPAAEGPPALRKFLRRKQVLEATALSNTTLYDLIKRDLFPRPIYLTGIADTGAVVWDEKAVATWQQARIKASDAAPPRPGPNPKHQHSKTRETSPLRARTS